MQSQQVIFSFLTFLALLYLQYSPLPSPPPLHTPSTSPSISLSLCETMEIWAILIKSNKDAHIPEASHSVDSDSDLHEWKKNKPKQKLLSNLFWKNQRGRQSQERLQGRTKLVSADIENWASKTFFFFLKKKTTLCDLWPVEKGLT